MIDKLIAYTKIIPDPDIQAYVFDFLQNKTPAYFKEIPASSSGKYHPKYALGPGGLVRHTIATVYFADCISRLEYLHLSIIERSKILAACFLHDTWKGGPEYKGQTDLLDHAKCAAEKVEDKDISLMILTHMGQWGKNKPATMRQFIVHLADYLASRKEITVDIGELTK